MAGNHAMERLSRFRRSKKEPTTAAVAEDKSSGSRTPSPAAQALAPPPARPREKLSRSPFRGLHLRSSGKRARESPPASLPHSASATAHAHEDHKAHASSPLSSKPDAAATEPAQAQEEKPKMPAFLALSTQGKLLFLKISIYYNNISQLTVLHEADIEAKFQELVWAERNRLMQGMSNSSPDNRWARVTGPHLKALDRYVNVQPWQNNRVKLKVAPGQIDYINASPISLTSAAAMDSHASAHPDRYIAMQGPKQSSTDHVWRMVVEQLRSPAVIVMLTETHEGMTEKCFPYFPRAIGETLEVNEHDEFGDGFRASVRCEAMEETPAGDAIELRKLIVKVHKKQVPQINGTNGDTTEAIPTVDGEDVLMKSPMKHEDLDIAMKSPSLDGTHHREEGNSTEIEEERVVYHFLYKKWPDFGVPALQDLDSFFQLMRLSRDKNADADNPRIVHCSAGVGRSGTFIALEYLMRELDAGVLENYDAHRPAASKRDSAAEQDEGSGLSSEAEAEDLIFSTVNQLREQRRSMVQAEAQYVFIYQVLRKLWQDKYGVEEGSEPAAKRQEVDPFVEE